jgi:hypothetical protein
MLRRFACTRLVDVGPSQSERCRSAPICLACLSGSDVLDVAYQIVVQYAFSLGMFHILDTDPAHVLLPQTVTYLYRDCNYEAIHEGI